MSAAGGTPAPNAGGMQWAMPIECPDGGMQADPHAGHTGNGRVFACGKGRPPSRGAGYRRRHCGPAAISPEKCEPEGVGHD